MEDLDSGHVATVATPSEQVSAPMVRDHGPQNVQPDIRGPEVQASKNTPGRLADMLAFAVAVGLAAIAAWFSLKGLAVLFPGAPHEIIVMGAIMECAKLVACGWLAGAGRHVPWVFRGVLMLLIAGLAVINASGTFSQLTAAHVGNRAVSAATLKMRGTNLDNRIEVAGAKLADLDRRLATIDGIVTGAEIVKQRGEISLTGMTLPNPTNQCWPGGVPYAFWNYAIRLIQQPHQITILYDNNEVRHVRMNEGRPSGGSARQAAPALTAPAAAAWALISSMIFGMPLLSPWRLARSLRIATAFRVS